MRPGTLIFRRHLLAAGLASFAAPAFGLRLTTRSGLITVRAAKGASTGTLHFDGRDYPCALGRAGIVADKREGDGGTPAGFYLLREVHYRPDRLAAPRTVLPVIATNPADGWCDDPADPAYNKLVRLPYPKSTEAMWRADEVYDVVAVVGYNDNPPVPGKGSAIFLHVVRTAPDGKALPTAGCVALAKNDLVAILATATAIHIATV